MSPVEQEAYKQHLLRGLPLTRSLDAVVVDLFKHSKEFARSQLIQAAFRIVSPPICQLDLSCADTGVFVTGGSTQSRSRVYSSTSLHHECFRLECWSREHAGSSSSSGAVHPKGGSSDAWDLLFVDGCPGKRLIRAPASSADKQCCSISSNAASFLAHTRSIRRHWRTDGLPFTRRRSETTTRKATEVFCLSEQG